MNLADRIVALGVGELDGEDYYLDSVKELFAAHEFVRSWEVTGALMEKVCDKGLCPIVGQEDGKNWCQIEGGPDMKCISYKKSEILPHAINLACVEALEA